MIEATLCFLLKEDQICLAMKKRGFGMGKWNGYGGKVDQGETPIEALVREVQEESGVIVLSENVEKRGEIKFYFAENPEWNERGHIYWIHDWQGEPVETEEMDPKWYPLDAIPYDQMWDADRHWLPVFLDGKKFEAEIHFAGPENKMQNIDLRVVDEKTGADL